MLNLMVFTPGAVRGAGFGSQGVQGRVRVASAQQSDRTECREVLGEGSAWGGATLVWTPVFLEANGVCS